jgi:hypothetical protein
MPASQVPELIRWYRRCKAGCLHRPSWTIGFPGPEDGTGGARRDVCTALHGPSDDIGVGLHWNQLPNPREAWGQTLQRRQRTQADDPGLRFSCHRTPCTLWRTGAPATRHSVPHPPRVASFWPSRPGRWRRAEGLSPWTPAGWVTIE